MSEARIADGIETVLGVTLEPWQREILERIKKVRVRVRARAVDYTEKEIPFVGFVVDEVLK